MSSVKLELFGHLGMQTIDHPVGTPPDIILFSPFSSFWPVRSVEQLPPYSPKQLKYPVLVIGNTVRAFRANSLSCADHADFQLDPVTPLVNAEKVASLLGDDGFLIERLGFGHSALAQTSTCVLQAIAEYIVNSTVCAVFSLVGR